MPVKATIISLKTGGPKVAEPNPVNAEVFSYGGCTSCGNSLFNFLRQRNVIVDHKNVQVPYVKRDVTARAKEMGVEHVYFPLIFIGGKVVVGFKPNELEQIISEVRNG